MQSSITQRLAILRRTRKAAIAIALAGSLGMGTAHAQWAVIDAGDIVQTTATAGSTAATAGSTAETAISTATTAANAIQTVTQLTSTISSIASNPLAALIPTNGNLSELSQTQIQSFVDAKCTTSSGGNIVANVIESAVGALDITKTIAQQQQTICANIIGRQADQYNATVDLYKQMPQLHNSMAQLQGMMTQLNGVLGNSSSATAQTTNFTAAEQQQISEWQTRVGLDKAMIDTLNQQQSTLASVALNAKPDLLGSATQAVALTAAFKIDQ